MINKLLIPLLIFIAAPPALAGVVRSEHTEVELLSEVLSIRPGTPFWVALRMKMDPHWHTYWRNPGDSGLATDIRWELPEGFEAGPVQWPYPKKIDLPPLTVYAYEGEIFLLTEITPPQELAAHEPQTLQAAVSWLECEINCIPGKAHLTLELPVREEFPEPNPALLESFSAFRAKLPLPAADWRVRVFAEGEGMLVRIEKPFWADYDPGRIQFFPYDGNVLDHTARQKLRKTPEGYELTLNRSTLLRQPPERLTGILLSENGWRGKGSERAMEIDTETLPHPPDSFPAGEGLTALTAFFFAFLGGMILNLMPCVFPVLSLKVLGMVEQAREHRSRVWRHGAFFTLGILVSFWVLAGLLIALRSAGHAIGWGFQLQSPVFIILLASVFFLLALNMGGVFEVGASLTGLGQHVSGKKGLTGTFAGGVLATVVATPCTAPFMGSALGYALTQPVWVSLGVFTFLALGMAFPYVLFSVFPGMLKFLPKPGPWMIKLKKGLAFLLLATVAWLVWILSLQAPGETVGILIGGFALMAAGCWVYGARVQRAADKSQKKWGGILAALLVASGILWPAGAAQSGKLVTGARALSEGALAWQPYSDESLQSLLDEGRPVFLNFTAAWCLTCHVNERVALNAGAVKGRFNELGVVLLKADWTSRDERITRALARYGRSSIPFYVLYGRGPDAEPVFLPEILTPGLVLEALEKVV